MLPPKLIVPISLTNITYNSIIQTKRLLETDCRTEARRWICSNLPNGAKIVLETYCPFIEDCPGKTFIIEPIGRVIKRDFSWYIQNKFKYFIFSKRMFGRYYDQPRKYSIPIKAYNKFFSQLKLIKIFKDKEDEIRIYILE